MVATLYSQDSSRSGLQTACPRCDVEMNPWVPHPLQSWSPMASLEMVSAWLLDYRGMAKEGVMACGFQRQLHQQVPESCFS